MMVVSSEKNPVTQRFEILEDRESWVASRGEEEKMKYSYCGKKKLYLGGKVINKKTGSTGFVEHEDLDAVRMGIGKIKLYLPKNTKDNKNFFTEKVVRAEFYDLESVYRRGVTDA
ncbi:MAG: hypothetical protein NUW37_05670 [Planctomycetes bacterium]|nr:hypothetical protein [Planctomycetota bacterium]